MTSDLINALVQLAAGLGDGPALLLFGVLLAGVWRFWVSKRHTFIG